MAAAEPPDIPVAASKLVWHWVVETLADLEQVDTSVLKALIIRDPEILNDSSSYGTTTRERVALRYLEECSGSSFATDKLLSSDLPSTSSYRGIELPQASEDLLCRHLQKVTSDNSGMCKDEIYVHDLREFILQKRAALPKSSLDLLKDSIVENCHKVNKVNNLLSNSNEEHAKKLQSDDNDTDIQSLNLMPFAAGPDSGNALFHEPSSELEKHFCKQNLSDGSEIGTLGRNHKQEHKNKTQSKKQSICIEGESSVVPESFRAFKLPQLPGDKNKRLQDGLGNGTEKNKHLAPCQSFCIEGESSVVPESFRAFKLLQLPGDKNKQLQVGLGNGTEKNEHFAPCQSICIEGESSVVPESFRAFKLSQLPGDKNKRLQDGLGNGTEKNKHLAHCQSICIEGESSVVPESFRAFKLPQLPGDKNKQLQDGLGNGTEKNKHLAPCQSICIEGESSVVPESSSDVDGYDAERHKLLISQNPITQKSLMGDWTEEKLCVKCDRGGQLLVCTASNCPIAVHESCLGSFLRLEDGGNFYCPLCSYSCAATAYSKARKNVSLAIKALSIFMGRGPMDQSKLPNPTFPREPSSARKSGNKKHSDEIHFSQWREMMKANKRLKQVKASVDYINNNIPTREADNNMNVPLATVELETVNHHQQGTVTPIACNDNSPGREASTSSISAHHDVPLVVGEGEVGNKHQCIGLLEVNQQTESASAFGHDCSSSGQDGTSAKIKEMQDRSQDEERCLNSNVLDHHLVQGLKHQWHAEDASDHNNDGLPCQEIPVSLVHKEQEKKRRQDAVDQKALPCQNQRGNDSTFKNRKHRATVKVSKRHSNIMYPFTRRSKLAWTPEEEEALKDGLTKFPIGDRGIPWVKILEYGRNVFHKTRTPIDLKDKWKNIRIKESVKK